MKGFLSFWFFVLAIFATKSVIAQSKPDVSAATQPAVAGTTAPEVVLLEPGAEPREPLRLAPKTGQRERVNMRTVMESSTTLNGAPHPMDSDPVVLMTFDSIVNDVDQTTGNFGITHTIVKFDVEDNPAIAAERLTALRAGYKQVEGMRLAGLMDSRGRSLESKVVPPEGASPELLALFEQMKDSLSSMAMQSAPLPAEAIGIGAEWRLATGPIGPTGILQQATYTLRERRGDHILIDIEMEQTAEPKQLSKSRLVSFESDGTGELSMDLARFGPQCTIQMMTTMSYEIGDPAKPSILAQTVKTKMSMESMLILEEKSASE